jgi:hypothetical protein
MHRFRSDQANRRHVPEDRNVRTHSRKSVKSYNICRVEIGYNVIGGTE